MKRAAIGAALLVVVTALLLLSVAAGLYSIRAQQAESQMNSNQGDDLSFARDALIDYSVNYPSHYSQTGAGPGHMPCPDTTGNGSPELSCSGSAVGLLPVDFETSAGKNISFQSRQASENEPTWYVLSSAFRYSPVASGAPDAGTIVNSETRGELTLDGEQEIIALLISPGPELSGQNRFGSLDIADFLEGENADGDLVFSSDAGNDRLLAIRWSDLMPLVERRVLATVAESVARYQAEYGVLPWLAPVGEELNEGDSECVVCQRTGWLASERFRSNSTWPPYSEQHCFGGEGVEVQETPELPVWLVRNYWHRQVWLHVRSDDRDLDCEQVVEPQLDEQPVSALMVSVGRALEYPLHGQRAQRRGPSVELLDYLDRESWLDVDGEYLSSLPEAGVNDQWSVVP